MIEFRSIYKIVKTDATHSIHANRKTKLSVQFIWFKRDMRTIDHRPLTQADANGAILPLLIIESEWWYEPDMFTRHLHFYRECVVKLSESPAKLDRHLVVRIGDAVDMLENLRHTFEIYGLWSPSGGDDQMENRDTLVRHAQPCP